MCDLEHGPNEMGLTPVEEDIELSQKVNNTKTTDPPPEIHKPSVAVLEGEKEDEENLEYSKNKEVANSSISFHTPRLVEKQI